MEIVIYSGFSVLPEVVLSLGNMTLHVDLNFKVIYYLSDLDPRTLRGLTPQSLAARGYGPLLCHLGLFRFCLEEPLVAKDALSGRDSYTAWTETIQMTALCDSLVQTAVDHGTSLSVRVSLCGRGLASSVPSFCIVTRSVILHKGSETSHQQMNRVMRDF